MYSCEVEVKNSKGLHARPATYFIQEANKYKSSIWVVVGDKQVNAKSLLGLLALAVVQGTVITIKADGIDETEAVEGLRSLVESGLESD